MAGLSGQGMGQSGGATGATGATGPVSDVTATAPLSSTGGATPDISTSVATAKIIGRTTAGTGVMEQLAVVAPIALAAGQVTTSMATNKLLGRGTAGTGVVETITLGTNLSLAGTTLNATGGGTQGGTTGATANAIVKAASADTLADTALFETTSGQLQIGGTTAGYQSIYSDGAGNLYVGNHNAGALNSLVALNFVGTYGQITSVGVGAINGTALYVSSGASYATLRYVADGVFTMENGTAGPGWIINSAGNSLQTGDVTKNNNTTVADLTGLSLNLTTGRKYSIEGTLFVDSSATGAGAAGIKITMAGTATASAILIAFEYLGATVSRNDVVSSISGTSVSTGVVLTDAVNVVRISGTIICSGTGTFKIQGAQASGVAADTIFKTASKMLATDVT